ncbi:MAG: prolipoprotein diacylglyceryl transferase [Bacteroidetes bacterium]|nr:prolipoprotein diacylglyceryl transferase [Bacteroidota bacterium]
MGPRITNLASNLERVDLLFINWDMNPSVIPSWNMPRWYGIMWALGFYLGYEVLKRMYRAEKTPEKWTDQSFIYVLVAGILGARLGHCLFYQPDYYLANPIEILKIWEGGLASHGGAFAIILAVYFLNKKHIHQGMLWILDHLVVPTALAGGLIRLGNLFNHEIVGNITTSPFGFKFLRNDISPEQAMQLTGKLNSDEAYSEIASNPSFAAIWEQIPARHPAQLYEAICYFLIFGLLMYLFWKTNASRLKGFLTGVFFITIFGSRFLVEFIKEDQVAFEGGMPINMGQILSIPLVLFGIYLVFRNIRSLSKSKPEPLVLK